ncbi:MAG TPA: ribonuclease III [Syntrophobacteraceae bacterium]|nr:ribonuclease III [Syntrophobacteraceae bacterium]
MQQATNLEVLQSTLHYRFRTPRLLLQALMHRSFINENPGCEWNDNETLEFLGDAVLGLAVSHLLWDRFPQYNEGSLSRLRSAVVNERELAVVAVEIGLGDYLFLGKGEEGTGGREKPSLLADTLEALLAAVYLDGGLSAVIEVVQHVFRRYLDPKRFERPLEVLDKDYKTQLQELTQNRLKLTPVYTLEGEEGPDHDKVFYVSVMVQGHVVANGLGKSKKEAQQLAARKALATLMGNPDAFKDVL